MKLEYFKPTLDNLYKAVEPNTKQSEAIYLATQWCNKLMKLNNVKPRIVLSDKNDIIKELKYLIAMSKQLDSGIDDLIQEQLITNQITVNLEQALMWYNYETQTFN